MILKYVLHQQHKAWLFLSLVSGLASSCSLVLDNTLANGPHSTREQPSPVADAATEPDVDSQQKGPILEVPPLNDQCPKTSTPQPSGMFFHLTPQDNLGATLSKMKPGDGVILAAGKYPSLDISLKFSAPVFVMAAEGAVVTFSGLGARGATHLIFRGIQFSGMVTIEEAQHVSFEGCGFRVPGGTLSAALITRGGSFSSNIDFRDCYFSGGDKATVLVSGNFGPADKWNSDLLFSRSEFHCGNRVCFQVGSARNFEVSDSQFIDVPKEGILTVGVVNGLLARNRFQGRSGATGALRLATPGTEWDNYDGVEYQTSTDIVVENNIIQGFARGIELLASKGIRILNNTVLDGTGLATFHRVPRARNNSVILNGNTEYTVVNNIFARLTIDAGDPRPMAESHNAVMQGGEGPNLVTTEPRLDATGMPTADSPVVDKGLASDETPKLDQLGFVRDSKPDIGALERGAYTPQCAASK